MCLNALLKELFHSFCVWWILMLSQESGWFILRGLIKHDVLCHYFWENIGKLLSFFKKNLHTKLLKVVKDFILFVLMLRNLLSIFVSSSEDWESSSCPPIFEKQIPVCFNSVFLSQRYNGIVQLLTTRQIWFLESWVSYTWQQYNELCSNSSPHQTHKFSDQFIWYLFHSVKTFCEWQFSLNCLLLP